MNEVSTDALTPIRGGRVGGADGLKRPGPMPSLNGAAVKRINGGQGSWLAAQRSAVEQSENHRSQAAWVAHSLLV